MTTTRWQTRCPTCGDPVHNNHRCRGAVPDPPCPKPSDFWDLVEQARREHQAAADAQTIEPLTLPLETP